MFVKMCTAKECVAWRREQTETAPERPLEPPTPKDLTCERCGAAICGGETYIFWHGERYCEDCALEAVTDELDESGFRFYLDRLAEMMNFDVEVAYS